MKAKQNYFDLNDCCNRALVLLAIIDKRLMLIILHAPIEEPDVADREEVREDGGSNVEREGSKHESCQTGQRG